MKVAASMTRHLDTVDADAPVREAAERMAARGIGVLAVASAGRLVGMLTDRDLAVRVIARGLDAEKTRVRVVMTHGVVTCYPDETARDAARRMCETGVRRLVVVDREETPIGLLSVTDLAMHHEDPLPIIAILSGAGWPAEHPSP